MTIVFYSYDQAEAPYVTQRWDQTSLNRGDIIVPAVWEKFVLLIEIEHCFQRILDLNTLSYIFIICILNTPHHVVFSPSLLSR